MRTNLIDKIVIDIDKRIFNNFLSVKDKLDYYRMISKKGISNLTDDEYEALKLDISKFFNIQFTAFSEAEVSGLCRISFNKSIMDGRGGLLKNISQLLGPPEGKSQMNRCNFQGESIFYSALDLETAIWETKPQPGDVITISEWKTKKGKHLILNSIFNHPEIDETNHQAGKMLKGYLKEKNNLHPKQFELFDEIIRFATEEFVKKVEKNKPKEYIFSAYFSSQLAKKSPNGFRIEAIAYPSIQKEFKTTNLAILNSVVLDKLDLLGVTTHTVITADYSKQPDVNKSAIGVFPAFSRTQTFDFKNDLIIYPEFEK